MVLGATHSAARFSVFADLGVCGVVASISSYATRRNARVAVQIYVNLETSP